MELVLKIGFWYIAVGLVVIIIIRNLDLIHKRENNKEFASAIQEANSRNGGERYFLLEKFVAPVVAAAIVIIVWPFSLYILMAMRGSAK